MKKLVIENKKTVKDVFIDLNEFERLFDSNQAFDIILWRALRTDKENFQNPLYPDFKRREITIGQFRAPDVKVEKINGVDHIIPRIIKKNAQSMWRAEGTSLLDQPNVFKGKKWTYIKIPAETVIPDGILIIRDDIMTTLNDDMGRPVPVTHYSIVPNTIMSVELFKTKLDTFAKNAKLMLQKVKNG